MFTVAQFCQYLLELVSGPSVEASCSRSERETKGNNSSEIEQKQQSGWEQFGAIIGTFTMPRVCAES